MKTSASIFTSTLRALSVFKLFFLLGMAALAEDRDMVLDGIDGDVTTNEIKAFINKLHYLPPPPTNDIGNLMVDERDGARLHGMQTFYEFTHDRRDLNMAIIWSDAFLHARNDPTNGRAIWTGTRDLCWPNKATNEGVLALHSSSENGDVIEHIVNTARLILENPAVWNLAAPRDRFDFGTTYLDRAKTYVRECQRSADTTIVPWFVRNTKEGYRLYYPNSAAFFKASDWHERGPIPWNQQQEIVGGLLRLAQCHRLLNDDSTNIAYYEKITANAANWFFATAMPVSAHDRVCYDWAYVVTRPTAAEPESTIESDYDMFIFRAWQANLGPTPLQMQRLINTARFVMYLGTNGIAGEVNGMSHWHHERQFLNFEWIEMSMLDHELYEMAASTVLTSHEYWNNLAVEAAVLSVKHYWATHSPLPEPQEALDPGKLPPVPQYSTIAAIPLILSRNPAAILLFLWIVSGIGRNVAKRFDASAAGHDPRGVTTTRSYLVAVGLGVFAAFWLPATGTSWPGIITMAIVLVVLGLALQWYARIQIAVLAKANATGSIKGHGDQGAVPYRFIWRLSNVGGLLAMIGLGLSFQNWASLLIASVPACALTLWRSGASK